MEAIIFCGIQGAGKTTFYRERYFDTHVRINLDMLRTRRREQLLLRACLAGGQPFVVDNTNVRRLERERYIVPARAEGFRVVGVFFRVDPGKAFERNRRREGRARIPAAGVFGTQKRLEPPVPEEGFDELYEVDVDEQAGFRLTRIWPEAA
jgi:predicted kinase